MRRTAALLMLLLALGVAAACGGGGDDGDATDATSASRSGDKEQEAGAAYPVAVEHAHGTTTIERRPERIVSLNVQWTDALLALGEKPVAYVLDSASQETQPYPWHRDEVAGIERIDMNGQVPYERLAALHPDLILATWLAADAAEYDRLNAIAPTIALLGDLDVDPWSDQVTAMAKVLGQPERARDVIKGVEAEVDAVAERFPGLEGKSYVAANYIAGDGVYVVADPEDGASRLFAELGMEIDPDIMAVADGAVGRVHLSLEQVSLLDADLIGILTNGSDPAALPGWGQLAAVKAGTVVEFVFADVVGLNTPTPLSVPYVLDLLVPTFQKLDQLDKVRG